MILKKFLLRTDLWITLDARSHSLHIAMYIGLWYEHLRHFKKASKPHSMASTKKGLPISTPNLREAAEREKNTTFACRQT